MRAGRTLATSLALGAVLTASTAFGITTTASGATAGLHGQSFPIVFRGTSVPLRQLAKGPAGPAPRAVGGGIHREAALLRSHLEAEGAEGKPILTGWKIPKGPSLPVGGAGADLVTSWQGSNQFDNRYADQGNQFSVEPPDQGLCVGGGYVMETINSVMQVFREDGTPLLRGQAGIPHGGKVGLAPNQVFGYPPTFVRPAGPFGPFPTDPSCYYDQAAHRWFQISLGLAQDPTTGAFTGDNGLDVAVTTGANPLGRWNRWFIPMQNDGTDGTMNHHCDLGPCIGDYPHIGADENGIYITTNEYSFFGEDYNGVQLYALSKSDLVNGVHDPAHLAFPNLTVPELSQKAFTLRGAQSTPYSFEPAGGGTEYFLSSTAGDGSETGNPTGGSDRLVVWALSDTSSLNHSSADPVLRHTVVKTIPYVLPAMALQADGPTPLLRCINLGKKCVGDPRPFKQEGPYPLDALDTRMMSSYFQDGLLWGTVGTGLKGPGGSDYGPDNNFAPDPLNQKAGVAYFAIRPTWGSGLHASVEAQGYFGVDDGNLIMPSLAMGNGDHGVIGATLVGPNDDPSAAYVHVSVNHAPTAVSVAGKGKGPSDGFTGTFEGGFRPRWGDYGYAVPGAHGSVWLAAENVAQRCSFARFLKDSSTCGHTRGFFANWATRIFQVQT